MTIPSIPTSPKLRTESSMPGVSTQQRFMSTCSHLGFSCSHLSITAEESMGYALVTSRDLHKGESLLTIPKRYLVTPSRAAQLYPKCTAQSVDGSQELPTSHLSLAHFLIHLTVLQELPSHIYTTSESHFWSLYRQLLPTSFPYVAVNLSSQLKRMLPDHLQTNIKAQQHKIRNAWIKFKKLYRMCASNPKVTFESFSWAWMAVNTRCVMVPASAGSGIGTEWCLIPLFDFFNHSFEASTRLEFAASGTCLHLKTSTPFSAGSQVFINYGAHDNGFTLVEYGFTIPSNPFTHLDITSEMLKLLNEDAMKLLDSKGLLGDYTINKGELEPEGRTRYVLTRLLRGEDMRVWLRGEVVLPRLKRYARDLIKLLGGRGTGEGGESDWGPGRQDVIVVLEDEVNMLREWLAMDDEEDLGLSTDDQMSSMEESMTDHPD